LQRSSLLVVQEIRISVLRLDRIDESKMYRVIDDRKNGSEKFFGWGLFTV
jgi:hypothetical protein